MDANLQYDNIKRGVDGTLQKIEHLRRQLMEKSNALEKSIHQLEQYWNQYTQKAEQIRREAEKQFGLKSGGTQQSHALGAGLSSSAKSLQQQTEQNEREYESKARSLAAEIERFRTDIGKMGN